ncbi:hypothetical protein [Serratia sp. M24T3]|uniref:hypothetical protein n=1 Tax=Serratia sp. M24T3 TaxID=932213 RepID=UPI00025BB22B|nr:hypothetical protein [Serratia sp. M24T3]EIC83172.1 hypothetical protein SPM24T3_18061 [Serratia sp. M24T3]
MSIIYDANIGSTLSNWYGSIVISKIRNNDGSAVEAESFLSFYFVAPVPASDALQISTVPWMAFSSEVKNQPIDDKTVSVMITIKAESGQKFSLSDKDCITIPFDAPTATTSNLPKMLPECCSKITITADQLPATEGTININCAVSPDEKKLNNIKPVIKLSYGEITQTAELNPGKQQQISLLSGNYLLQAETIENEDATAVVPVIVAPKLANIIAGNTSHVEVSFGKVSYFSAVDFKIEKAEEIADEQLKVSLKTEEEIYNFDVLTGVSKNIRRISYDGNLSTDITPLKLNNKHISFNVPVLKLEGNLVNHVITRDMMECTESKTSTFQPLKFKINTDSEISKKMTVRLLSDEMNYVQEIEVKNLTITLPLAVMPGSYRVVIENFIDNKILHIVKNAELLVVNSTDENILNIDIKRSANLSVRGFPDYLSFGGCITFEGNNKDLLVNARTSSIFKYAGTGGDGNPHEFLAKDDATVNSINMARAIENELPADGNVLPVMISYTVQLSGGGISGLGDRDAHMHCYGNFILALSTAQKRQDAAHPVSAGFIVNPDFLGECQKNNITKETPMPVRSPLGDALKHWNIDLAIPEAIEDNVGGYIQSVNWLARTIAPSVTFGWQINLWGVGSSIWIYDNKGSMTPQKAGKDTADYLKSLQVYSGDYCPDFLAIDRYEADDLTIRSYVNSYCYGPHEWRRFYDFCAEVSEQLNCPVMPWQIPASRTPLKTDYVTDNFEEQHWGSSANYLFGDAALGSDVKNIHSTIREFDFNKYAPATAAQVGATPEHMYTRKGKFDVSEPGYKDFAKQGIFAVLLGGGCTLGIVPPLSCTAADTAWVGDRLNAYRDQPLTFLDTLK